MTLMSNRCTSARGEDADLLYSSREPPYGIHIPHYFYVQQKKPQSLAPLKAWRGYKGNVYFQPMLIQKLQDDVTYDGGSSALTTQPPSRNTLRSAPSRSSNSLRGLMSSSSSARPYRLVSSSSPLYVMDRSVVAATAQPGGVSSSSDLRFIEGMESTGSLTVAAPNSSVTFHPNKHPHLHASSKDNKRLLHKRERICKGSNFHKVKDKSEVGMSRNSKVYSIKLSEPKKKLVTPDNSRRTSGANSRMSNRKQAIGSANSKLRNCNHNSSELVVNGDKYTPPPQAMSPMNEARDDHLAEAKHGVGAIGGEDGEFVRASHNLPRVNQVHVSMEQMADNYSPRNVSPFSDNVSNQGEDSDSVDVDYVDMNFKGLTTDGTVDPVY